MKLVGLGKNMHKDCAVIFFQKGFYSIDKNLIIMIICMALDRLTHTIFCTLIPVVRHPSLVFDCHLVSFCVFISYVRTCSSNLQSDGAKMNVGKFISWKGSILLYKKRQSKILFAF